MTKVIVDAGPFIHLNQINALSLLKKFFHIYTTDSVISEIRLGGEIPIDKISKWQNFTIIRNIKEPTTPKFQKVIKSFRLHLGEKDVICLADKIASSIVLTDDMDARSACENLRIEVHGTAGIIAYAYHKKWITYNHAQNYLRSLQRTSSLFITSAIIENAIKTLKKY